MPRAPKPVEQRAGSSAAGEPRDGRAAVSQGSAARNDKARERLVEWLRAILAAERALADRDVKRELREIEKQADALLQRVNSGPAAMELLVARDELGFDSPLPALHALRDCASHARAPRRNRQSLRIAAAGFLYVLYSESRPKPKLYALAPEVLEFTELLHAAGATRDPETAKTLLSQALKTDFLRGLPPGLERRLIG